MCRPKSTDRMSETQLVGRMRCSDASHNSIAENTRIGSDDSDRQYPLPLALFFELFA